jgi:hypothetical protein
MSARPVPTPLEKQPWDVSDSVSSLPFLKLSIGDTKSTYGAADGDDHHILGEFLASRFKTDGIYSRSYTDKDKLFSIVIDYKLTLQTLVAIVTEPGGLEAFLSDPDGIEPDKMKLGVLMQTLKDVYGHKKAYRDRLHSWDNEIDAIRPEDASEVSGLEDLVLDALVKAGYLRRSGYDVYVKVRSKPLAFVDEKLVGVVAKGPPPNFVKDIKKTDDGRLEESWVEPLDMLPTEPAAPPPAAAAAAPMPPRESRFYLARDGTNKWIFIHETGRQFEVQGKYVGWSVYAGTWAGQPNPKFMMVPSNDQYWMSRGWTLPPADKKTFKMSADPNDRRFVMRVVYGGVRTLYVLNQINRMAASYVPEPDGVHVVWTPVGGLD